MRGGQREVRGGRQRERGGQREATGGRRMIDLEWMEAIAGWVRSFENGPQLGGIIFKLG